MKDSIYYDVFWKLWHVWVEGNIELFQKIGEDLMLHLSRLNLRFHML